MRRAQSKMTTQRINHEDGHGGDPMAALANGVDSALRYLRNIRSQPVTTQIAIGSGTGLATGFTFSKTSKVVAVSVGCTIIALQFCNYRGYLKFNRTQLQRDLDELKDIVRDELGIERRTVPSAKELDDFLTKNGYLFTGFIVGVLIGYGLS